MSYIRPYASVPESGDYDFEAFLGALEDNLRGPVRQFRSRMLDLGKLVCVNPDQKAVFRDVVFDTERDMTALVDAWVAFYCLGEVKDAIRSAHES